MTINTHTGARRTPARRPFPVHSRPADANASRTNEHAGLSRLQLQRIVYDLIG